MSDSTQRVRIVWTYTAANGLRKLPKKVRAGLMAKADELEDCDDPKAFHKPLTGPLKGYYRITYSRYRAVYKVFEDEIANGDVLVNITVCFVAAGKREEHSKDDVYKLAEKFVELGLTDIEGD
ncbi:MAG: hypothetical protein CMJ35_16040 [Phycisphaerae bacterium]|nr:hypothetical protein [Phycisphaerae bacterium]MBM93098.1 hypothetical protein [Phycisphaerae bacterium]|tara:strand:- start:23 stop:391 length:369 start_codon:yes stop_codon:yes gene_type:complete